VALLARRESDRLHRAAINSDKANVTQVPKDIDVAVEHRRALVGDVWTHDGEINGLRDAVAELARRQMQEQGEWKAVIGDVHKKARHERRRVSRLKEAMGNVERERENLQEAIAANGAKLKEEFVSIKGEAKDCQRQSQERDG
jgi:chromosome segregation ATPase